MATCLGVFGAGAVGWHMRTHWVALLPRCTRDCPRTVHAHLSVCLAADEEILIENLRPSNSYSFMVSTRNEVGQSEPFILNHEMPDISQPYPIVIVSDPRGLYPYEYTLNWEKPRTGGIDIEEYQFSYRQVSGQYQFSYRRVSGEYQFSYRQVSGEYQFSYRRVSAASTSSATGG